MATKTVYPNGLNIKKAVLSGGATGTHSVDTSFGLASDDVLEQALALTYDATGGTLSTALDITSGVSISADNQISTGTATTGAVLEIYFADQDPNG